METLNRLEEHLKETRSALPDYEWEYIDRAILLLKEVREEHSFLKTIQCDSRECSVFNKLTALRQQVLLLADKLVCMECSYGCNRHKIALEMKALGKAVK